MKNYLSVVLLCMLVMRTTARDKGTQVVVETTKTYAVSALATLDMQIDFANVIIGTSQNNEIKIVMRATGLKDDDKCRQEVIDHFENATRATSAGVSIVLSGVFDRCKVRQSCSAKVTVEISIPSKANVTGSTSFGNLSMSSFDGLVRVKSEYGNVAVDGLWSYNNSVSVEFGNLSITGTNGGTFKVEYGNLEIGVLQGSAMVSASFGNLAMSQIASTCTYLTVKVDYGNAELQFDASVGYQFDVKSAYGKLDLSPLFKVTDSDKDYTEVAKKGTIGNGSGKLFVNVEFGNVHLNTR